MGASGEDEDGKEEYDDEDGDRRGNLEMDRPSQQFCREAFVLTNMSVCFGRPKQVAGRVM